MLLDGLSGHEESLASKNMDRLCTVVHACNPSSPWEAEAGGWIQRAKLHGEFEVILGYMRLYLRKTRRTEQD